MSLKSPLTLAMPSDLRSFPRELHLNILTFLRATDLSALQRTSRCFNNRELIVAVVDRCANEVYPSDLTSGFDTPIVSGEVRSVAVASKKGGRKGKDATPSTPAMDAPTDKVYTYEMLRNMEMLVVARVLSRPEPPVHARDSCFYVSKSWCRAALQWLEVQEEERKEREERRRAAEEAKLAMAAACTPNGKGKHRKHPGSSGKKKLSRKQQRQRDRKMSDAMPPWSNINTDIVCEHGSVKQCSTKSARARRRVMDKQAWKVLKALYPESVQLEAVGNGCLMCAAEEETAKKAIADKKEEEKANRKKPLSCPLVRGFYTRGSKGVPSHCLAPVGSSCPSKGTFAATCPLKPGVYCALPRSWCHQWRKYIKTGEGGPVHAPDSSEVLCDAHNIPLVPPHLESFLRGETSTLLGASSNAPNSAAGEDVASAPIVAAAAANPALSAAMPRRGSDHAETLQALRAAGLSEAELHAQRLAMAGIEENLRRSFIHDIHEIRARDDQVGQDQRAAVTNEQLERENREQLDRENRVVVEILTDDEVTALEKWWPRQNCTYALRFAVVEGSGLGSTDIIWSTAPCRECDPSSKSADDFAVKNRRGVRYRRGRSCVK